MSTSGTITFRVNRNQLINGALRLCGAVDPENASGATANQISNAAEALNMMVKSWQTVGLELWERKYGVIFPQYGQTYYVLGSPGPAGDHACLSTPLGSGFIRSTLTAAAALGATTITLAAVATTGTVGVPSITITIGDNIGIQQTDGTMFWTTVTNVNTLTKVVTLNAALTVGAALGAYVNDYTTKLSRPLRILDGFVRQVALNDVPIKMIPREVYNRFGVKTSTGTPVQGYYDPQSNTGDLYIYPTCVDVTQLIYIEFQTPIQDFSTSTDDFDMPQEWAEALKFGLAYRIAPEYTVPKDKFAQIKELALSTFAQLDGWDQEDQSIFIQPDSQLYYGNGSGPNG